MTEELSDALAEECGLLAQACADGELAVALREIAEVGGRSAVVGVLVRWIEETCDVVLESELDPLIGLLFLRITNLLISDEDVTRIADLAEAYCIDQSPVQKSVQESARSCVADSDLAKRREGSGVQLPNRDSMEVRTDILEVAGVGEHPALNTYISLSPVQKSSLTRGGIRHQRLAA